MNKLDQDILNKLTSVKITNIQLDPNGYCNNKCWFCPVAYSPNPASHINQMETNTLYKILKNCKAEIGYTLSNHFNHVWTAHYNEILLYRNLEDFFKILKEFGFITTILTNGINLTDDKIDLLIQYDKQISAICLNVPAADSETYERYTGQSRDIFGNVVKNIKNVMKRLQHRVLNKSLNLMINGVDDDHRDQRQDYLGVNAPKIPIFDLHFQEKEMKQLFPDLHIYKIGGLSDRASHLSKYGIFNHSKLWAKRNENITGCLAKRMYEWIHINSLGNFFLCCNDYNFEYEYGSIHNSDIRSLWISEQHINLIKRSLAGICRTCGAGEKL